MGNDEKFCGYIEGFGATTSLDRHGDKLNLENLKDMKKQFDNKKVQEVLLGHDKSQPIGQILKSEIITKEGWAGIKLKVGIYKRREDILNMFKKGKLNGFSWGGWVGGEGFSVEDLEKSKIKIEVEGEVHKEVEKILDSLDIKYGAFLKKSIDAPTIIAIVVGETSVILTAISLLYQLWKDKKKEENKNINLNIVIKDKRFNYQENSIKEIEKRLRESLRT